jgi:prefoldin subunit 5
MKKGLLTVLLASLVLVGCQNYDDQFDDLNAQISALKSQVDGLSSLSGQVSSLSGSISGLQAGVNAAQAAATAAGASADAATAAANGIDLSGLSASLATLQAEVDAVQASLATAATATAVAALQTELDAIEADVDELLATSNVYNTSLVISSASTLDAAVALGNNLNIVNGSVTITQSTTMDATKLQSVIDKIFTVTGNYSYTASAATVTAMTFDKLASTGDLTLAVNGPISAKTLVTAGTVNLKTTFSSKVTSINMDLLSSVTEIQSQGSADTVNFSSATDIQLGALAIYTDPLTITTKKGATLDIGSLDDLNAAGTAVDMGLTVSGPKDVTISGWDDSYTGTITATNVENLTITDYEGAIVIGNGTENATVTGGVNVSLSGADDLVTVDLTTKLYDDPNVAATNANKKAVAYGGNTEVNSLSFSSANLTTIKLAGYWDNITSTDNANVTSIDIDATIGTLTVDNNDNLTSFDVTGSEINNVVFQNNSGIETVEFDHTTELNYVGATADDKDVTVSIVDNEGMTSLTWGANYVQSLTVTGNDKLATIDFTGLAAASTGTTATIALNVRDNGLTSDTATDIVDGLSTQYEIDGSTSAGVNNDALDLGTYAGDGGMSTLKPYLELALADADATGNVHFDAVTTHSIDTDAIISGETAGAQNSGNAATFEGTVANGGANSVATANWVGLVWYNDPSDYESDNPTERAAQKEKRAWVLDVSSLTAGTTTISMLISSTDVFESNGTFGDVTIANTGLTAIINQLKTTAAVSRAADLGATLDIYVGANSKMPSVTLKTGSTSASNFEGYTDAQIAALESTHGVAAMAARVTTYDQFTYTVGGKSVVASITLASGVTSAVGTDATAAVASAIVAAWNAGYGAAGTSDDLSFWGDSDADTESGTIGWLTLESANSGSRAYGQSVSFDHSYKASAGQISLTVAGSGNATYTFIDWIIGSDDKQLASTDNKTTDVDLIISLEETLTSGTVINGATAATVTLNSAETLLTELTTAKLKVGTQSTLLAGDIFITDAGEYTAQAGGGSGDVRNDETADEGLAVTSGSKRAYFSRIHWLVG